MASIKFSSLVGDARGSIGGTVFSRNANGAYVRNRTTPVNPSSTKQITQRSFMNLVINAWRARPASEKHKWSTQVSSNGYVNRLGESMKYTGYQLFVKRNLQLLSIGRAMIDEPPVDPVFPTSVMDGFTVEAAVGGLTYQNSNITFDVEPGDANQWLVIDVSGFVSSGATSSSQVYSRLTKIDASSTETFDISTQLLALLGTPVVGARVWMRAKIVDDTSGLVREVGAYSATVTQGI